MRRLDISAVPIEGKRIQREFSGLGFEDGFYDMRKTRCFNHFLLSDPTVGTTAAFR